MAPREKIRSLVFTTDSEFKMKTIAMLNNIAFAAEKHVVQNAIDAANMLDGDATICNAVFDATADANANALIESEGIKKVLKTRKDFFALFYVNGGDNPLHASELGKMANVLVAPMPIDRKHFMDIFYRRRGAPGMRATQKVDDTLKLAAQDAAQHLKGVVDRINAVATDRTRLDQLAEIGQRYNGLMGTFQFFQNTPGARELADLGTIVDAITRTYEKSEKGAAELSPAHLELLVTAFKCTLPLIRTLALGDAVSDETNRQIGWARSAYGHDASLKKRGNLKQATVDAVLDKRDHSVDELQRVGVEASSHLKSVIESLNSVFKDHTQLSAMAAVGQRFNGFFGALTFYRDKLGNDDMINLGALIDDLCRSYADAKAGTSVSEDHIKLLRDAAETCLFLLKDLREGKPTQEQHRSRVTSIVTRAREDVRIHQRRTLSQNDVDQLLEDLAAA